MKNTVINLNVDFIGGLASLTKLEQIALSEYFKQQKFKNKLKKVRRANPSKQKLEKV